MNIALQLLSVSAKNLFIPFLLTALLFFCALSFFRKRREVVRRLIFWGICVAMVLVSRSMWGKMSSRYFSVLILPVLFCCAWGIVTLPRLLGHRFPLAGGWRRIFIACGIALVVFCVVKNIRNLRHNFPVGEIVGEIGKEKLIAEDRDVFYNFTKEQNFLTYSLGNFVVSKGMTTREETIKAIRDILSPTPLGYRLFFLLKLKASDAILADEIACLPEGWRKEAEIFYLPEKKEKLVLYSFFAASGGGEALNGTRLFTPKIESGDGQVMTHPDGGLQLRSANETLYRFPMRFPPLREGRFRFSVTAEKDSLFQIKFLGYDEKNVFRYSKALFQVKLKKGDAEHFDCSFKLPSEKLLETIQYGFVAVLFYSGDATLSEICVYPR